MRQFLYYLVFPHPNINDLSNVFIINVLGSDLFIDICVKGVDLVDLVHLVETTI